MRFLLVCAASLALFIVADAGRKEYDLTKPSKALFEEWKADHPHVKFASEKEEEARYKVFMRNVNRIKILNVRYAGQTQFQLNHFGHLSEKEFSDIYLSTKVPKNFKYDPNVHSILPEVSADKLNDLPLAFDWRKQNPPVVTPVKDQGMCGSCWAFSTTGNVEGQWALAGNPLVSLSEQNLVDCDHMCVDGVCDSGCNGGLMENAFAYVIKNGGIATSAAYPYEGRDGKCRYNPNNKGASIANFTFIPKNALQMQHYLVEVGPIAIAADATMWQFYYSGVWYLPCGTSLNHGILIVGYGVEKDVLGRTMPYWIVKNSWGARWGMGGYILIERGNNRCGLQEYPITALMK